jgi:hypothetical protein
MDKSETKTVYAYDEQGKFISEKTLDYTDRSPVSSRWQIPAYCTETEPPEQKEGFDRYFKNGVWEYAEIEKDEEKDAAQEERTDIQDTSYVSDDLADLAGAVIDLYDNIEILSDKINQLEGGK